MMSTINYIKRIQILFMAGIICFDLMMIHAQDTGTQVLSISPELSEKLSLFDLGEYESAITLLNQHAMESASESGIAYYFTGESYYNMALRPDTDEETARARLHLAIQSFNASLDQGLEQAFPEKIYDVLNKLAWAHFRLAEIACDPLESLLKAQNYFERVTVSGPPDLVAQAIYMFGEMAIRRASYHRLLCYLSENRGEKITLTSTVLAELSLADRQFNRLRNYSQASSYLKSCALLRENDILLEYGLLFAKLDPFVYDAIKTSDLPALPRDAAKVKLNAVRYDLFLDALNLNLQRAFSPITEYLQAYQSIFLYLLTGDNLHSTNLRLDSLVHSESRIDKLFFLANRDHRSDIEEQRFIDLSRIETSHYFEVTPQLRESHYWLGWIQDILGLDSCSEQYSQFLDYTNNVKCDRRILYLRENAQLRLLYLMFDRDAAHPRKLQELKTAIQAFDPTLPQIKHERNLLLSLIRVGLNEDLGNIFSDVNEVMELIRYMLPKAALVYGKERVQYLKYLDQLLEITQYQKSDQTKFYQGISIFLRAEIQPLDQDVVRYYTQAAEQMGNLAKTNSKYRYEARYIEGRSHFDAAKHELNTQQKERRYQQAKIIFMELIRDKKSLRSLFYLGEIYKHENQDAAAGQCYQAVIQKTCFIEGGEFWCRGAQAALKNCRDQIGNSVPSDLKIQNVVFPENLNENDIEEITLEKFGYQEYIKKHLWAESIDMLIEFGLPRRQLYPSKTIVNGSCYHERDFHITASIEERLLGLKSGLELRVLLPNTLLASEQAVQVYYNGSILQKNGDVFRVDNIPLNESGEIRVINPYCYSYHKKFKFNQPRNISQKVTLVRRFQLVKQETVTETPQTLLHFPERLDNNSLFLNYTSQFMRSPLYGDFLSQLNYRDIVKHDNQFYVIKDSLKHVLVYQGDGSIPVEGVDRKFELNYTNSPLPLKTPEGIAVDSTGNLYICDVDQNCVFVFNSLGQYTNLIGYNGTADTDTSLHKISLFAPKRIAVSQINESSDHAMNPIIVITDRNGIHACSPEGDLFESISNPGNRGAYYAVSVTGYGESMDVYVWNRKSQKIECYKGEPILTNVK